jgi:chaperone required for assembly of F1-ATPase
VIQAARKRVYKEVAVVSVEAGYGVTLDGKPVHTPARRPLVLPTREVAEAVAAEWQAQEAEINPLVMPLTRLAGSALDLVAPNRAEVVARTAAYGGTDLVCYRAEGPPELASRQQEGWQPLVDWAAHRFDAPLKVTVGVMAVEQPAEALAALSRAVEAYDDLRLTVLAAATAACGSLLLALALAEGRLDAETAFTLSQLDESFQIEQWGEDPEIAQRRANLRTDIAAAAHLLALLAT